MAGKLPNIHFYPGDWLRDPVSACSLAAQGLWLRMMICMHDSERYGFLCVNGSPIDPSAIARRCGCPLDQFEALLAELLAAGVPSVTPKEIIFSRRMVRDHKKREESRKNGAKGGNPILTQHLKESEVDNHKVIPPLKMKVKMKREKGTGEKPEPLPPGFVKFWEAWPKHYRKDDKDQCAVKWRVKGCEAIADKILVALDGWNRSEFWNKQRGEFICAPLVWLNKGKWEAEIPPPARTGTPNVPSAEVKAIQDASEKARVDRSCHVQRHLASLEPEAQDLLISEYKRAINSPAAEVTQGNSGFREWVYRRLTDGRAA